MLKCAQQIKSNMKQLPNKAIAIYEMIGGAAGLLMSIWLLINGSSNFEIVSIIIMIFTIGFYILSIFAGYQLHKDSPKGLYLSMFLQALQIPYLIGVSGFTYYINQGVQVVVTFGIKNGLNANLSGNMGNFGNIGYIQNPESGFLVGANLLAILLLTSLIKSKYSKKDLA